MSRSCSFSAFSLLLLIVGVALLLCVAPSMASHSVDSLKTELREGGGGSGSGSGNRNSALNGNGVAFNSGGNSRRRNSRSIYGIGPKMLQISRSKIPIELDLLVENDDGDRSKRFDDYGHMRFGKRGGEEQFDDYGHMRFGRR